MPSTVQAPRLRVLRDRLGGGALDASTVASASAEIWRRLAERLEPVIGTRGTSVLMALHRARQRPETRHGSREGA